ncbi:MAG: ATP-binding protein [Faecalibacterium sp.]
MAAAVSGGADSMALLRILLALQPEFGFELSACHVNHGLRGESADRDEAFVRAECARLGVPLRVFHAEELGRMVPRNMPGRTGPAACATPALRVCAGRG